MCAHGNEESEEGDTRADWMKDEGTRGILQHSRIILNAGRVRDDAGNVVPKGFGGAVIVVSTGREGVRCSQK